MSGGFVKIYGSILDSSIWATDLATRVVWLSLLTMADRHGVVAASIDGIARRANVSEAQTQSALQELQAPDPKSKSRAHSGRRVRRVDGGWLILNYTKYREIQTDRQAQSAERARRYREKHKDSVTHHARNAPSREKTPDADADADRDVETTKATTPPTPLAPDGARVSQGRKRKAPVLPPYDQVFEEAWSVYPKRPGNAKTGAWRQWLLRVAEGAEPLDMLEGARRYAAHVTRERTRPRFVKQAQTFFGPDRHFASDYSPAQEPDPTPAELFGKMLGVSAERVEALWAEEDQGLAISARKRGVA